ncbi:hypothetical protein [Polaromonas sp. UC242_47]|uniref:hypothetical protein n=1 Tax=Polaromonas sp. UC242_47 TaxID=3374626 RepID=UPI00379D4D00
MDLVFGAEITSLHASNGSGKTPIMQAIAFCLGVPETFREDLASKVRAARLTCSIDERNYVLERSIDKEVYVSVKDSDGKEIVFTNERAYSDHLFQLLKITTPTLVGVNRQPASPYLSTTLPVFYLDQDSGYSAAYKSRGNFIKDQFVETIRFLYGFHPKNSFTVQKNLLALQEQLAGIDRKIVFQESTVEGLRADITTSETAENLHRQIEQLKTELSNLRSTVNFGESTNSVLNGMYAAKSQAIQKAQRDIESLRERVEGIESISNEILAEADTLGLNEEARRQFMSFSEICSKEDCCLFISSSQSYAKNLLYLKDQMKDLELNSASASSKISHLEGQLEQLKSDLEEISKKIHSNRTANDVSSLVDLVGRLTQEIFALEKSRAQLETLQKQNNLYLDLLNRRKNLQEEIGSSSSSYERDIEYSKFRMALKGEIVRWLDILRTKNVSRNVNIDSDLNIDFGGERLDPIKGSTKIRVVLAIHAAFFQLYLQDRTRGFRFLILDTPRQHEMDPADLLNYLDELKHVASKHNAQIVISSTDFRFKCGVADAEWTPQFQGPEQNMYLGAPQARLTQ